MKLLELLGKLIAFWSNARVKYNRLKADEERRESSTYLGVQSIVHSVLGVVLFGLCLWGLSALFNHFTSIQLGDSEWGMPIFTVLGMLVLAVSAVVVLLKFTAYALVLMIYQFKLNKKPVRWVAFALWFVCIAGYVILFILFFL